MSNEFFRERCAVLGMVHLRALPGTPRHSRSIRQIIDDACREAETYAAAGIDGLLIENMHDRPYLRGRVGPEIVSAITAAACAVRGIFKGICGVQVLAGANEEALAVAAAADLDFIRCEGFVFAHIADEGLIEGCAGPLLRQRKAWGADRIRIFTDIKKKHSSHAITADVSLAETARAAEFFGSDGVIISGVATGQPVSVPELAEMAETTALPVLVGSGATAENIAELFPYADALIVGSHFKHDGCWTGEVDALRIRRFMDAVRALRAN